MEDKIKEEFFGAKHWASKERENQVSANHLMLTLAVREKDKYTPLINKIAKSQKVISKNAKQIKEIHQKQLKETVKEELAKNKIILGETNESAYTKIRRIIDIAELEKSSIYVRQQSFDIYEITTEDYGNVIFEGTAKEILLIMQIISGYKKEELYKKISEKEKEIEKEKQDQEERRNKMPKYTPKDFINDLEENINRNKEIREKLKELEKMLEDSMLFFWEENDNIKWSLDNAEKDLEKLEEMYTIYLQEEQEELKNKGGNENE